MSSNFPQSSFAPPTEQWKAVSASHHLPVKSRNPGWRGWLGPIVLFFATLLSTTYAGLFYIVGDVGFFSTILATLDKPSILLHGLPFSIPLITILLAHEMGHYFACRYYGIRCTPPYFIPAPISIAGTLGAFIRIKSSFKHKRALFDVGVAGPLAGFLFVIPSLYIGIKLSQLIPKDSIQGGLIFGEPLFFRWMGKIVLGYSSTTQDMVAHPIAMAAWFGLLATSLNLLPIWQLDGGHLAYAILGRTWQKKLTVISIIVLIFISFLGWPIPSYLLFGLLLLFISARFRFYHPPTLFDGEELGRARILVGILAIIVLIISFIPVPISFS